MEGEGSSTGCAGCGRPLEKPVASISGSIMGDEETESWFHCPECGAYTLTRSRDRFHGEEVDRAGAVVATERAERHVAIIRRCERPWDKKCRCEAHREYFGAWLD